MTSSTLTEVDTDRDAVNVAVYAHQAASPWRGFGMDKCAQDLLVYQEIVAATRPDIIVETGAWQGGSALFFADLCALNGHGAVLSIDIAVPGPMPGHPRLSYWQGDSVSPETVAYVLDWANGRRGMVILDSDHRCEHVLAELDAYSTLVEPGCFLVVEDTNVNAHPVRPDFGPGPWEAVHEWLPRHPGFVQDREVEPYVTFAPGGYLRRKR